MHKNCVAGKKKQAGNAATSNSEPHLKSLIEQQVYHDTLR